MTIGALDARLAEHVDSVEYSFVDSTRWVTAVIDGVTWELVDIEQDLVEISHYVHRWIDSGNTPAPCSTGRTVPLHMLDPAARAARAAQTSAPARSPSPRRPKRR